MCLKVQCEKFYKCENYTSLLTQQIVKCKWVVVTLGHLLETLRGGVILLMSACPLNQLYQVDVWEPGTNILNNS